MLGQILADNDAMLTLAKSLRFSIKEIPGEDMVEATLDL